MVSLSSNQFQGPLPSFSPKMAYLDLSYNLFSGTIPPSFVETMHQLASLLLSNNLLHGTIPSSVCNATTLHVLDLSNNFITGGLLACRGKSSLPPGLQILNLANNNLSGNIPDSIGNMKPLESLDLSKNRLSGTIPSTMSMLSSLSHLNLSDNNLSGRIPLGNQLQTLDDPIIYLGNNNLCGFPLKKKCPGDETSPAPVSTTGGNNNGNTEMLWFYIGAVLGLVVGFWAVFGILILKKNWRIAYFRYIDRVYDKFYVAIALMFID